MKNRIFSLVSTIVLMATLMIATPNISVAQESNNQPDTFTVIENCEDIESKLEDKVTLFTNRRDQHNQKYGSISENYGEIITKLGEAEYNTSILEELETGLDRRISDFQTSVDDFIEQLTAVKDMVCDAETSLEIFKAELETTREDLLEVQDDSVEIYTYVNNVLISAITNTINSSATNSSE